MKRYTITVNGKAYDVTVEENGSAASAPVQAPAAPAAAPKAAPAPAAAPANVSGTKVNSPMPGTVLKMKVKAGDAVKKGDVLCVLEAMKMENEIASEDDGTVKEILVKKGDVVQPGQDLIILE